MIGYIRANLLVCVLGLIAAITLPLAAYQTVRINGFLWFDGLEEQAAKAKFNLNECREGRKQDRATYEQAQRDAKAKNEADVARIKAEQDRISDNVQSDLNARLERLRSELRRKNAAPGSSPNRPGAGSNGEAPGTVDGEAGVCLAPEALLRAAENEERHDQLITWVEQQLGVRR